MTYLLDINALVALLVEDHEFHERSKVWAEGKVLAVCPLTELGFLRVSINAYSSDVDTARKALAEFWESDRPQFVPADVSARAMPDFRTARQSTDIYLATLAAQNSMRLATFDSGIKHDAAELI